MSFFLWPALSFILGIAFGRVWSYTEHNRIEVFWDNTFIWYWYWKPTHKCIQIGWLGINTYRVIK